MFLCVSCLFIYLSPRSMKSLRLLSNTSLGFQKTGFSWEKRSKSFQQQTVRNKLQDNRAVRCISFNVNVVSINFVINNSNTIIKIIITVPERQSFEKIKRQQCVVLSLGRGVSREGSLQRFYCNAGKRV